MSILSGIKNAGNALLDWMKGEPVKAPTWTPAPPADTSRYLHVSVPLIPGKGVTYRSLRGECKRNADVLAAQMGLNNKQRRRMRAKILARATELHQEQAA